MPSHSEIRHLPYTARQMYDLVADVAQYPRFLPWCAAARIRKTTAEGTDTLLEADLVISFKVFREKFGSHVRLSPDKAQIDTEYLDGPFHHMHSTWVFTETEAGCEVKFDVDFELRNAILQKIIGVVFNDAMHRIVRAFEARAGELYG